MGQRPEGHFQRHTDGQRHVERMLNLAKHQRHANQNHESHFTPIEWLSSKRLQTTNVGEGNWRKTEPLVYCWRECKLVQPLQKTVQRFLKEIKIELL